MFQQGLRQGDPLSSLLFCFSVLPEYLSTVESAPGVRAVAIVDDLELVGPHASVLAAFDHLSSVSLKSGLVLGRPKCHLFWPRASPVPESLSAGCASRCLSLVKDGLPVLGALLSRDPAFSSNWFQRRVSESHARLFELLGNRILPTHHAFVRLFFSS